jgi:hypothetical protein
MDRMTLYRIDAADTVAHWAVVANAEPGRNEILDPFPLGHPGKYRYLMVGSNAKPARVVASRVLGFTVH